MNENEVMYAFTKYSLLSFIAICVTGCVAMITDTQFKIAQLKHGNVSPIVSNSDNK